MKDGKTPRTGWHWKITPEQIEKLKAKDIETLNKVYFDNLELFKKVGLKFCYKAHRNYDFYGDFLNQVYVDLPFYNFKNTFSFYFCLRKSFKRCRMWLCGVVSIETPIKEADDLILGDSIADEKDIIEEAEQAEAVKEFAPKFFEVIEKVTGKDENDETIRDLAEYVFTGYTYSQILKLARSGYAVRS